MTVEKKRVLIHIGMGRCGSSSIQKALTIKRSELGLNGIFYPVSKTGDAHHYLGWLTDDKLEDAQNGWIDVLAGFEKSGCPLLLLSTENFAFISPKLFAFIQGLLLGYSVEVIFIARNQRELLPSIYAQWMKAGIIFRSFGHFFSVTKKELHFIHILERWSAAYGANNVKCGILSSNGEAIQIFAECCGISSLNEILKNTRIKINSSINPLLLSVLVLFDLMNSRNKVGPFFPGWNRIEPSRPDRNATVRGRLVEVLEMQTNGKFGKIKWRLGKKWDKKIAEEYQETNKIFQSKYLIHLPEEWSG